MQIDFHHAVTYVTARIAGFDHDDAGVIAYAAQYVDDSTQNGPIIFDTEAVYLRTSSAHKMLDLHNLDNTENHLVWLPFHFLPGNEGKAWNENPDSSFVDKVICKPNSLIAQEMVRAAILDQNKPNSLHRLGVAMHVYADTWAHQGFAGILNDVNKVDDAKDTGGSGVFDNKSLSLSDRFFNLFKKEVPPLGHGRANVLPDMPFLTWEYTNGYGKPVTRNNTDIFCDAANGLFKAMQRYRLKNADAQVSDINGSDMNEIQRLFTDLKEEDGEKRHIKWIKAIEDGIFSFGKVKICYDENGRNSWKAKALETTNFDTENYKYPSSFLESNWKLFHDALQLNRLTVLRDILPKYGICAG